jgi:hypothetical protein
MDLALVQGAFPLRDALFRTAGYFLCVSSPVDLSPGPGLSLFAGQPVPTILDAGQQESHADCAIKTGSAGDAR